MSVLTDSLPKVFKRPFGLSADKKFPISSVHFLLKCSWRKECLSSLCCYPVVRALARKCEFLGSIHAASLTTMLDWEEEEQEGNRESPPFRLKLWPCFRQAYKSLEQGEGSWGKRQSKIRMCISHLVLLLEESPGFYLGIFAVNSPWIKIKHWLGNSYQKPGLSAYSSLCLLPSSSNQCHTFAILSNRDTSSTGEVMNASLPFCSPSEHLRHSPGSYKMLM